VLPIWGNKMKSRLYILVAFVAALLLLYGAAIPSVGALQLGLLHAGERSFAGASSSVAGAILASPQLWLSPAVPAQLRRSAEEWGIPLAADRDVASLRLDLAASGEQGTTWVYALVAPFPTIPDGVTFSELMSSWRGSLAGPFAHEPLLMDESTLAAFTAQWGAPSPGAVQTVGAERLLDTAWNHRPSWAIVPFEALEPRWKVLSVDGQSPVQKDFRVRGAQLMPSPVDYPLIAYFKLRCSKPCAAGSMPVMPPTNRDPAKMTTVVMTGVTALVRATAFVMNTKGITYPGRDIRDWLAGADITHVSNEVPFATNCPAPDPKYSKLVFCSDPRYIELLKYIGTDVIELTGNHYADYGPEAMRLTLAIYGQNGMSHYGGGADLEDARKPVLLESNGNKIAFIGCNSPDIGRMPTATVNRPGAAPCDYDYMTSQIRSLRSLGYLVITSFQYYESYSPTPFDAQVHDFRLMAQAGSVIVQGSQAHNPESMEFDGGALIHYGLGNLFFDQMGDASNPTRQEFIDRHVFYDGRYISTELLSAELEDYARPRPMTPEERAAFLSKYFAASGW
jgi:Bacterial capsule synthesis protein PGA_cap